MRSCLALIPEHIERVYVAYSGGLDSSVLLHLLVSAGSKREILPWHVNHGLVATATRMQRFCEARARDYGLPIRVDYLDLSAVDSNIEAEARRRRYRLFARHCGRRDCVVTAHHADDQAETFLLNALRAAGSAGLRGIAVTRPLGEGLLLRPLLGKTREGLEKYAAENDIAWFEDPSNRGSRFDRNYLRNEVLPKIASRWPGYRQTLAASCRIQAENQRLLEELGAIDLARFSSTESAGYPTIDIEGLAGLSEARRKNLVRYWLSRCGQDSLPNARLQELIRQLDAKADATPSISMPHYSLRIYDNRLFLVSGTSATTGPERVDFAQNPSIEIEQLELRFTRAAVFEQLGKADRGQALTLKFRKTGADNPDRHRLKRLFQKHRVPPWERERVAQVYLDGRLEGLLA